MSSFEDICGQENIKTYLTEAISTGKLSHAYIFNGESGSGKKLLADAFAETLQCEHVEELVKSGNAKAEDIKPCGKCHSCIQAEAGSNPDIIRISYDADAKKSIGVDDIREKLINDIVIKPYEYDRKVYIVEDAQRLTAQAQNALLKTLEEPPEYAVIILLATNADILLDTIRSRCVVIDMEDVPGKLMKTYLQEHFPDKSESEIEFAVIFADGKLGRAIDYLSNADMEELKDSVIRFVKKVPDMALYETMTQLRELDSYKINRLEDYLDILQLWYRDVLMFKSTRDMNSLVFKSEITDISRQAQNASYEGLNKIIEGVEVIKLRLAANVNFDIAAELFLITIHEGMVNCLSEAHERD